MEGKGRQRPAVVPAKFGIAVLLRPPSGDLHWIRGRGSIVAFHSSLLPQGNLPELERVRGSVKRRKRLS